MSESKPSHLVAVRSACHELSRLQLDADYLGLRAQVERGTIANLRTSDAAVVAAALVSLDRWAAEVRLVPPGLPLPDDGAVVEAVPGFGPADPRPETVSEPTRWILSTSGTTGEPKRVSHTLESLTRTVAVGNPDMFIWGLLYDPNRMAGLQVLLQGLLSGATLVAPPLEDPLRSRIQTLVDAEVNAVSATPSLWRQILQLPITTTWDLRQITLGGEIADQPVLDALSVRFPDARIVHVFASTETGAAFSVKDRLAGFPATYLDDPPRGVTLQIRDEILHVYSPGVSTAGDDGFASTGDVVEIVGDRVMFRGRSSGVVNIGGANVWPEAVEEILRQHDDVFEAMVDGKPNAVLGNVLVAQVVLRDTADPVDAPKRLRRWVRDNAPRSYVPASVTVVDELVTSTTGKVVR